MSTATADAFFAAADDGHILEAFAHADTDGGGALEIAELRTVLQKVNSNVTEEEVAAVFAACDPSGDGHVTLVEFMKAKRRGVKNMKRMKASGGAAPAAQADAAVAPEGSARAGKPKLKAWAKLATKVSPKEPGQATSELNVANLASMAVAVTTAEAAEAEWSKAMREAEEAAAEAEAAAAMAEAYAAEAEAEAGAEAEAEAEVKAEVEAEAEMVGAAETATGKVTTVEAAPGMMIRRVNGVLTQLLAEVTVYLAPPCAVHSNLPCSILPLKRVHAHYVYVCASHACVHRFMRMCVCVGS